MVFILFMQVLKKVLKSLKFELKNPAETLKLLWVSNLAPGGPPSFWAKLQTCSRTPDYILTKLCRKVGIQGEGFDTLD